MLLNEEDLSVDKLTEGFSGNPQASPCFLGMERVANWSQPLRRGPHHSQNRWVHAIAPSWMRFVSGTGTPGYAVTFDASSLSHVVSSSGFKVDWPALWCRFTFVAETLLKEPRYRYVAKATALCATVGQ
jgi:hypothetical protein